MITHSPWIGANFKKMADDERMAIVGYSHWGDGKDSEEATCKCIENVISGDYKLNFFTTIRNYFDYTDHGAFWNKVVFFNYLPDLVGSADQRFMHGTTEQHDRAKDRFRQILAETKPSKVLVFTSRHWAFPEFEHVPLPGFPKFTHGKLTELNQVSRIFLLRHPQGAKRQLMRGAILSILSTPT